MSKGKSQDEALLAPLLGGGSRVQHGPGEVVSQ